MQLEGLIDTAIFATQTDAPHWFGVCLQRLVRRQGEAGARIAWRILVIALRKIVLQWVAGPAVVAGVGGCALQTNYGEEYGAISALQRLASFSLSHSEPIRRGAEEE